VRDRNGLVSSCFLAGPVDDLARSGSRLALGWLLDLDGSRASGHAGRNIVVLVHGDEWRSRSAAEGAFNSLQQSTDVNVAGGDLDTDELVVFLGGAVRLAGFVVKKCSNLLGELFSTLTQALVVAVDFIGVVAVCTLLSMDLEIVRSPGLGRGHRPGDMGHGVFVEANHSVFLGHRGRLGVYDGGRHGGVTRQGRHVVVVVNECFVGAGSRWGRCIDGDDECGCNGVVALHGRRTSEGLVGVWYHWCGGHCGQARS